MGGSRSILFATWGLYDRWERVKYVPSFEPGCKPVEARSVLPLLLECVSPKPEKTYVFVADTVLTSIVGSYDAIVEDVRSYYLRFVDELGIDRSLIEVVVAPGVGEFRVGDGWVKVFRGNLSDYCSYAFYKICEVLSRYEDSDLRISLDLTHGINYMPALTYRALKEALEIAALDRKVELAVYNSEPHSKGVKELRVHLVEARRIPPRIIPEGLSTERCRLLDRCEGVGAGEAERLGRRLDETKLDRAVVDELNAFLGSLVNGLPLALLTFYPNRDLVEERLNRALEIWRGEMEVRRDGSRLLIFRKASLNENFVRLVRIWLAAKILNLSRRGEASLRELHEIRERIYSRWKNLDSMISRDLKEVEEDARRNFGILIDRWKKLRDLGKGGEWAERNFLAHSGLERNVTEVSLKSNEIVNGLKKALKLRYLPSEKEKVLRTSSSGLTT